MSYDQFGVKGHVGVTGVKKVIFTKKSFKSNRLRSDDHVTYVYDSILTPSTKVMGLENHPGSFEVTGVKSLFSLKML